NSADGANWDRPRILINGTPTVLTGYNTSGSSTQSGTMTVPVTAGQTFGFNVFTLDNSFGAATVTFSNFVASATPTLQWTASNGGTIVGANNQLSVSVSSAGTYTLTASNGTCTAFDSVDVNYFIATPQPTANATQSFCDAATVNNLQATGTAIQWFVAPTGGTALNATDVLTNGTTYYVSQTLNGCESIRLAVNVLITPSTTNTTDVSVCDSYTWAVNGTTYTTSGTYNFVSGCTTEVLNLTITPSTTNTTTASACDSYTWTVNGTTYTTSGTYNFVSGCTTEVLNLTITPNTTNTTDVAACNSYTWAVNGTTYTTSGTYNFVSGCSTEILNLTINSVATPTGNSTQTLSVTNTNDATIADIVVSPTNVIWYGSSADALAGINALDPTTVVTTGSTYYAVSVSGTCSSSPLAVTITVELGTEDFNNLNFSYYPNPTSDILNIKYSEVISEVSVTNLLGQAIFTRNTNSTEIQIDLSSLPTATYLVKVTSDGKSKIVKVIKR
uniref:T9SS type A sorting domain-containing protein n=1 Tax=Flavobacterium sp. TaxID=239 RepID=UPI00260DEFB6